MLKPQLSSGGLCYSYNAQPQVGCQNAIHVMTKKPDILPFKQVKLFKESKYMKDFVDIFRPASKGPIHPSGVGPKFGFFMILNTQTYFQPR